MERIEFTRNYSDLSTNEGFQFEFFCDRCGSGYRTPFQASVIGRVSGVLDTASGLFGGILGKAAYLGERARSAGWEQAHDKAFAEAAEELKPTFARCPRCSSWVCRDSCWNEKRGLCKNCAPDLGVEMSAAQASHSVQEIWAHARMAEEDKKLSEAHWNETIRASCPNCEAPLATNAKFCPECGASLKAPAHCTECGAKLQPNAKFCAECGTPAGQSG
jgi:membrane protease subunit (stomatin/prohibitin family)